MRLSFLPDRTQQALRHPDSAQMVDVDVENADGYLLAAMAVRYQVPVLLVVGA
jgi:hypothetical protein